jgi:hypothetical protein
MVELQYVKDNSSIESFIEAGLMRHFCSAKQASLSISEKIDLLSRISIK